jgi:hypothetical protein
VGQGITGKEGDVAIGRCFELGNQLSCSAEGAFAYDPGQYQFVHRTEGDPDPGIPSNGGQFLQGRQAGLLLGNEGPQLIQLALEYMQMTKEIPHDVLTMCPQDGQPVIHGVFVNAQQPSRGPDTHTFRQGRCPT